MKNFVRMCSSKIQNITELKNAYLKHIINHAELKKELMKMSSADVKLELRKIESSIMKYEFTTTQEQNKILSFIFEAKKKIF